MTKLAFINGIVLALQTIRTHKLRAFLTVLGVIIGTGTIIGVSAILTGFDASITGVLRSFGPNSIIVFKFPVGPRTGRLSPEERTRKNLTYQNAVDIRERCKSVEDVSTMLFPNRGPINVHYKGNDMYDVNLIGVEEAYARGGQVDMHLGRFFTDEESRRRMPVAVIGADIEKGLFANVDPIGKTITVDGHEFKVIGTMLRPAASFFGDTDNRVLLPYGTMQKMYPNARENAIVVTAKDGKLPQAHGRSPHRAAHRPPRALRQARQLRALHRRADGGRLPPDHRDDVPGDGGAQLDRPAGGRHRRDEHHAGLGDRADLRDRHPQGASARAGPTS